LIFSIYLATTNRFSIRQSTLALLFSVEAQIFQQDDGAGLGARTGLLYFRTLAIGQEDDFSTAVPQHPRCLFKQLF
jgi:hypothetical protein